MTHGTLKKLDSGKYPLSGFIPLMVMYPQHKIDTLNTEIFFERIIYAGNIAMMYGNNLLNDDELEIIMLLRANRDFMTFIRERHTHANKQNFKKTIIKEEQNNE